MLLRNSRFVNSLPIVGDMAGWGLVVRLGLSFPPASMWSYSRLPDTKELLSFQVFVKMNHSIRSCRFSVSGR